MIALFHIKSGELIKTYLTESAARVGMRAANRNAGWDKRISRSWTDGYEMEWCSRVSGPLCGPLTKEFGHAPYGITEYSRWLKKSEQRMLVKSLMTGNDVEIRAVDKGGPCDPSTELYWSM